MSITSDHPIAIISTDWMDGLHYVTNTSVMVQLIERGKYRIIADNCPYIVITVLNQIAGLEISDYRITPKKSDKLTIEEYQLLIEELVARIR